MELIWIRHFQTPGNVRRAYIGRTDEPLDKDRIPDPIPDYGNVDQVNVSPMLRCRQTAGLLYPNQEQMIYEDLREMDFGDFEQKTYDELNGNPLYQAWIDSGGRMAFPGGEGVVEFQNRCVEQAIQMIEDLCEQKIEKTAVVVHGGTIMAVMSAFDREMRPYYDWQVKNGKGYRVKIDEEAWINGEHYFDEIFSL